MKALEGWRILFTFFLFVMIVNFVREYHSLVEFFGACGCWGYAAYVLYGRRPATASDGVENGEEITRDFMHSAPLAPQSPAPAPAATAASVQAAMNDLRSLIGLSGVKTQIDEMMSLQKVEAMRRRAGGARGPGERLGLVFSGPPGTGKTTVARLVGQIYAGLGLLKSGHLVECQRTDLVADVIGGTALKTRAVVARAIGGVLFVDEAYSLAGEGNDFGKEAIAELIAAMETHRENLCVIVAGYSDKMNEFLSLNPGLSSRFPTVIRFEDYSARELYEILALSVRKAGLAFGPGAADEAVGLVDSVYRRRGADFGNAREIENLLARIKRAQAMRLARLPGEHGAAMLAEITVDDLREVA